MGNDIGRKKLQLHKTVDGSLYLEVDFERGYLFEKGKISLSDQERVAKFLIDHQKFLPSTCQKELRDLLLLLNPIASVSTLQGSHQSGIPDTEEKSNVKGPGGK